MYVCIVVGKGPEAARGQEKRVEKGVDRRKFGSSIFELISSIQVMELSFLLGAAREQ